MPTARWRGRWRGCSIRGCIRGSDAHLQTSQEEIANLSGLSRQRCNAALNRLREAGLLRIEYGGITVIDLEGLRRFVEQRSELA